MVIYELEQLGTSSTTRMIPLFPKLKSNQQDLLYCIAWKKHEKSVIINFPRNQPSEGGKYDQEMKNIKNTGPLYIPMLMDVIWI